MIRRIDLESGALLTTTIYFCFCVEPWGTHGFQEY